MTDIHTHVVPNVDDGASSIEESVELLNLMASQGITSVIATPHFYAETCLEPVHHKEVMQKALSQLISSQSETLPHILLGHEVHYFKGISSCEEIKELTIQNSSHMLIELPFGNFGHSVTDEIVELSLNMNIKPILAHIERYVGVKAFDEVLNIIKDGFAEGQVNCDSIVDAKYRKLCLKLIKTGYISYISTDTHNTEYRAPHMKEALAIIEDKLGKYYVKKLTENADNLFSQVKEQL